MPAQHGVPNAAQDAETDGDSRPPDVARLRPERELLIQNLRAETNALLRDVEAALGPLRISDPATLGTAWILANNWAVLIKDESTAEQRIPDPIKRKELADLHRRIFIDVVQKELLALAGEPVPMEALKELESLGRKHVGDAAFRRLPPPASDDGLSRRRRAAAGEESP